MSPRRAPDEPFDAVEDEVDPELELRVIVVRRRGELLGDLDEERVLAREGLGCQGALRRALPTLGLLHGLVGVVCT